MSRSYRPAAPWWSSCRLRAVDQLYRAQERTRLGARLTLFGRGVGVGDDPRACLDAAHAVRNDGGADTDARVHAPVESEITDGAGIRAAPVGLELGDPLHGADLRRAGHGPGREARAKRVERVDTWRELAIDYRREMHHVGEAGDAPTSAAPATSMRNMYGDGLTCRSAR